MNLMKLRLQICKKKFNFTPMKRRDLIRKFRKDNFGQTSNTSPFFLDPCLQKVAVKLLDCDPNYRTDNYSYILCPLSSVF
jgi:hypothetical protein